MKAFFALALPVVLLQSCDRCSDDPPPIAPVTFYFANQTGKNLIRRNSSPFHPDSIQIFVNSKVFPFRKEYDQETDGYKFDVFPGGNVSDLFLIRLNQTDTDSLEVLYTVSNGKCFSNIDYTVFFFNGKQVFEKPQSATLMLVK